MGFLKERLVAFGFMACACVFGAGLLLIQSMPDRHSRRFASSVGWRIDYEAQWAAYEARARVGGWLCGLSATAAVILLLVGLMIAFGIGPDWLCRWHHGAKVEERVAVGPDGNTLVNAPVVDEQWRGYVRVRLRSGSVEEYLVDGGLYSRLAIGQELDLRVIGGRAVDAIVRKEPR